MVAEVERLEIVDFVEKGRVPEVRIDGTILKGVKGYELYTLPNGEPECKLTLNIKDVKIIVP